MARFCSHISAAVYLFYNNLLLLLLIYNFFSFIQIGATKIGGKSGVSAYKPPPRVTARPTGLYQPPTGRYPDPASTSRPPVGTPTWPIQASNRQVPVPLPGLYQPPTGRYPYLASTSHPPVTLHV